MSLKDDNSILNGSGCKDPTAYEVIKNISKLEQERERQANELIHILKFMIRVSGFDLIHRIAIKDKESGKEYR